MVPSLQRYSGIWKGLNTYNHTVLGMGRKGKDKEQCITSLPFDAYVVTHLYQVLHNHGNLPEIAHTCKCAEGHGVRMSEYYTCSCVCCDTSLPLIYSTWSPSLSRGIHTSAGVLGATRDTMIGIPWSAPPYNDITYRLTGICNNIFLYTTLVVRRILWF